MMTAAILYGWRLLLLHLCFTISDTTSRKKQAPEFLKDITITIINKDSASLLELWD
jgi:hypothetical protein